MILSTPAYISPEQAASEMSARRLTESFPPAVRAEWKRLVVVVGVNHRLNVFGYINLGDIGGTEYAHSGNAGQLDIVAALEWVRDNIERFGGDPNRVMIFGESGGGGKVSMLLASPPVKGLFHAAAVQSGPGVRMAERKQATAVAEVLLSELGLSPARLVEIQACLPRRFWPPTSPPQLKCPAP